MSGIIGHTMYAILAGKAASARKLPIAPLLHQHSASYLCGAYLGCDIQTLPEAICIDTGEPVGYGTVPLKKSPITGGKIRPWTLRYDKHDYTVAPILVSAGAPASGFTWFHGIISLIFALQRLKIQSSFTDQANVSWPSCSAGWHTSSATASSSPFSPEWI